MPTGGLGSGGSDEGLVAFGPIALTPSTAKTVVRIKAPSSGRVRLIGWHLGVSGLAWDDPPVWVQIGRISADGTFTAGSPAPDEEELSTTFQTSIGTNASVEPTYSGYLRSGACTVTQPFAFESPADRPSPGIGIAGGGMLGFSCLCVVAASVSGWIAFTEGPSPS